MEENNLKTSTFIHSGLNWRQRQIAGCWWMRIHRIWRERRAIEHGIAHRQSLIVMVQVISLKPGEYSPWITRRLLFETPCDGKGQQPSRIKGELFARAATKTSWNECLLSCVRALERTRRRTKEAESERERIEREADLSESVEGARPVSFE